MGRNRAAYMREYRKRKPSAMPVREALALTAQPGYTLVADEWVEGVIATIANYEVEVARLKRELAARPANPVQAAWSRSQPAPKVKPRG